MYIMEAVFMNVRPRGYSERMESSLWWVMMS